MFFLSLSLSCQGLFLPMDCTIKQLNKDLFVVDEGLLYISEIHTMLLLSELKDCTPNMLHVEKLLIQTAFLCVSSREVTRYVYYIIIYINGKL